MIWSKQLYFDRETRMLTSTLFGICALLCLTHAQNDTTIEQTLLRSKVIEETVRQTLDEKLPPSAEAHEAGEELFGALQRGLVTCDQGLKSNLNTAQYTMCIGEMKAWAMASIGELAGQHWAKSGASRPGLFC